MTEGIEGLNETFTNLNSLLGPYGIHLPNWIYIFILIIILSALVLNSLDIIISKFFKVIPFAKSYFYDDKTKNFIDIRMHFIGCIEYEVEKLNSKIQWDDVKWNDSLHYTELEADVEVKEFRELYPFQSKNPKNWVKNLFYLCLNFRQILRHKKIEKNLTEAITNSNSQAFIIIGDPGSGKTISLRHIFLEMAEKAKNPKNKNCLVPLYINLKELNIDHDKITPDEFYYWIIRQLTKNKDFIVSEFIKSNFGPLLSEGKFFFLFDSLDEIPIMTDSRQEKEVISKYLEVIDNFLHAENKRRGLVSSRPCYSLSEFNAQKITIRPLSDNKIEIAIKNYLRQESVLYKKILDELSSREDLLHIIHNPFYLAFLTQYYRKNKKLPNHNLDSFKVFVQNEALKLGLRVPDLI